MAISVISKQISTSITYIRVIATISIVVCHILQYMDNNVWGQLFNTGVQVFFVVSGYIFGLRNFSNWGGYFEKRIKRIFLPYILFLLIVIPLYTIFYSELVDWDNVFIKIIKLCFVEEIKGLGYLWFVIAILICYLAVPIIQKIKGKVHYLYLVVSALLLLIINIHFAGMRYYYILLFALAYLWPSDNRFYHLFGIACTTLLIVLVLCKGMDVLAYYEHHWLWAYFHCLTGFAFFYVCGLLFTWLDIQVIPKTVKLISDYSYEIYVVHGFYILGPFSPLCYTENFSLGVLYVIMLTIFSAYLLKKLHVWTLNLLCPSKS